MITGARDKNLLSYPCIKSICAGLAGLLIFLNIGYRETINYLWNLVRFQPKS